ncbi:MAG: hypothetical protein JWQ43_2386 [Glaciihabitans sp.]|nr:hypothetical protein [Glaciihabitans sp.]
MSIWRCRVCEGINTSGRVCSTCGAVVPRGESVRAAVRTRLPGTLPPTTAPPPVPATPTWSDVYGLPSPKIYAEMDPYETSEPADGYTFTPLPGGCLTTFVPGRSRLF